MRNCSKRNKSKSWLKTYGKALLRKRPMVVKMSHKGAAINEAQATITMGKHPIPESNKRWGEWDKDELKRVREDIFTKHR